MFSGQSFKHLHTSVPPKLFIFVLLFVCYAAPVFGGSCDAYRPGEDPEGWQCADAMDFMEDNTSHSFQLDACMGRWGAPFASYRDCYYGGPKVGGFFTYYNGNPAPSLENLGYFTIDDSYFLTQEDKSWGLRWSEKHAGGSILHIMAFTRFKISVPPGTTKLRVRVWAYTPNIDSNASVVFDDAVALDFQQDPAIYKRPGWKLGFTEKEATGLGPYTADGILSVVAYPYHSRGPSYDTVAMNIQGIKFYSKNAGTVDSGLRIQDGDITYRIACQAEPDITSPLQIFRNGKLYGIVLVDPSDSNAMPLRVKTAAGIKAVAKLN